jgi:hypothetical protein
VTRICGGRAKYLPEILASESEKGETLGNLSSTQEERLNQSSTAETAEEELKEVKD